MDNVDGLHEVIARAIIEAPRRLRGQEVRFLRSMLDISQDGLARILGITRVQVARWETSRNKQISGTADRAIRLFYAGKVDGERLVMQIIDILTEIDDLEHGPEDFRETNNVWRRKAA